ncbi:N utilization substance protein B [Dysgonomonas sp. PFB1-18]|uniref:transcription antitermination factor NusB n=1 Tax=unclassified Dysgonomonas TaxID=2630389 RepID=UPI00247653DE|nr:MULTISPECIES: transcription antitermination factor NusB [unclassified Dysgonomonas]MDH6309238.1 N utilization substance protein B [Dysgonomonas sp. PF1-14]MDH6338882.1 N utilization substance protein B [Dysgonomonas sp. PF1-16]MDH6380487.1 N utilization substance protein B [Dysgonomonas sp. PFB1-18]MDH6397710.1 N utilization substance protein B [Dysgonomonas sp. PF1-23]
MINRVLIRIRVVQILFSCSHSETTDLRKAENELIFSLQKSYDLYFYLLSLMVELTDAYAQRVDARKSKLLPTEEDKKPNTRLLDNKFINQLRTNSTLAKYLKDRPFSWMEHDAFIRNLLDNILNSDIYKEYIEQPQSYDNDREFWRKIFKHIVCVNEDLYQILEDESLYWNDDIEIIESFVLKTIKRFDGTNGSAQEMLPMFKDETDREFAVKLLRESLLNGKEYKELIDKYTKNWESERIALMDMVIMQIAITEIMTFPSIPISVTLNEYIDIAKSYSTAKSASFINGILDAIVKELKEDKKIIKK